MDGPDANGAIIEAAQSGTTDGLRSKAATR
jgi:hypothetical protein